MESRNSELKPGYNVKKWSVIKRKRLFNRSSLVKKEIFPEDSYYIPIPKLNSNQVIVPDTMNLVFKFNKSNTKSWLKNNLGRILGKSLNILVGGENVYDNRREDLFETYKDLWKSEAKREELIQYGVANENIRKLMSGDDSATTSGKTDDVNLEKNNKVLKMKLGKILQGHGPFAPYNMTNIEYRFDMAKSEDIMVAQTREEIGEYKLSDVTLEFETIESEKFANEVKQGYISERHIWYDHITHNETIKWVKDKTRESVNVSIPRKSMKAIVLLFTKTKRTPDDSEEFLNANIEKVSISIGGVSNCVYNKGLTKEEVFNAAKRFFATRKDLNNDNLKQTEFLKARQVRLGC